MLKIDNIMQKKVTLSLDSKIYEKFQKFCEQNDIILSKRVERLIIQELNKEEDNDEK